MNSKLNLLILLMGTIIIGSLIPGASALATVSTTHPYMLFHDISQVPGYQYQTQAPWSTWQNEITTASNGYLSDSFAGNLGSYDDVSYRGQFAEYLGLSYQITKNTAYAAKAKEALMNMGVGSTNAPADYAIALEGYSLAYDWIQPTLSSADDATIRDNLATLADKVYGLTTENGKGYVDFPDLDGHLYPALGMASAALADYTNPNHIALTSGPSDWYHFGTDYLFVNDLQHTYGTSMLAQASDPTGKDLLGAYKAYTVNDLSTWYQVANSAFGINVMKTYPIAEKYFTSETWESLPNDYSSDFVTNGNTMYDYEKGVVSLMTPADQATVINHMKLVEADNILPNSNYINGGTDGGITATTLYCVYGNYNSVTPTYPATTSHLDATGVQQIIRQSWSNTADWLSFTTWNNVADSNRNMIHNDQLGFEYYSRGDLLLSDAGEPKHILDGNYGEEDIDHNVIAIDNPRTPFTLSPWSGSTSAGLIKGMGDNLITPASIGAMFQLPWMQLVQSNVTATKVTSGAWGSTQTLSSPIQWERTVMYPESDYMIIVDRMQGTETWGFRNIFRPSSLMVTSSTGLTDGTIGHDNVALSIGSTPYNWQSLSYQTETNTGLTADSLTWTTTNPYGKAVTANLVTSPASPVLIEKNDGRIGGYSPAAEVYVPVVYFKNAPATSDYRVTALLSSYSTETPKTGTEVAVTGTGHALNVHGSSYDDYIYTGTGASSFGTYSTDANTAYIRTSAGSVTDYTMLGGSYLNVAGSPLVSLSQKVAYFTAKKSGSQLTFQVSGQTSADITINGASVSSVTMDGAPFTGYVTVNNGTAIKISTSLSTHQFVVSYGNSLTINPIAPQSVTPGTLLTFPVSSTYTGKGTLTYSATNMPSGATFNTGTQTFAWTPTTSQTGVYNVTFSATDGSLQATANAVITVGSTVSQPPVISPVPAQSVTAGNTLTFVVTATDPAGKSLTYSATNLPSGATFNTGTQTFAWTPSNSQAGTYTPTFSVTDGTLSASTTATITVAGSGSSAPVITPIPAQSVTAGNAMSFVVTASDPAGNALTYSASNLPSGATFNTGTHTFAWTPTASQTGTFTPTFSVTDGTLMASTTATITVTAAGNGSAPVITAIPAQSVTAGNALSFVVTASCASGKTLTYSASTMPSGATFNTGTHTFAWTPTTSQTGTFTPTFSVTDGTLMASTTATIVVVSSNSNAPVIAPIPSQSVAPGALLDIVVKASDPAGKPLTLSASNLPSRAAFRSPDLLWVPLSSQVGTYTVTITATDGTYTSNANVNIVVGTGTPTPTPTPTNNPPVINPVPAQSVTTGKTLTFVVTATDPAGKSLTYSASNMPSGATFNTGTQTFTWTPSASQVGTFSPTFSVSDGSLMASTTATITVTAASTSGAPVITAIPAQTVSSGSLVDIIVQATSPSGKPLTLSASNLPSRAVFRSPDFLWVPISSQVGTYKVTFTASDGTLTSSTVATITVQ